MIRGQPNILQDLCKQTWPNCLVSVNWYGCNSSIRMPQKMVAASDTNDSKSKPPQYGEQLSCADSRQS
jgi:hypothetical protein